MDDRNQNRPYDAYDRRPGENDGEERERQDLLDGRDDARMNGFAAGAAGAGGYAGGADGFAGTTGGSADAAAGAGGFAGPQDGGAESANAAHGASGSAAGSAEGASADAPNASARPVYYYSYGPFRPGADGESSVARQPGRSEFASSERIASAAPHRPVAPVRTWTVREKPRRSWTAPVAAFLAGVLLTGTLMFAADVMNLFTGGSGGMASQGPLTPSETDDSTEGGSGGSSGGTTTASTVSNAIDIVRPNNIAQIVERASPAVVKIETYVRSRARSGGSLFDDPFFRQFFGDYYRMPSDDGGSQRLVPSGLGSGFFFDKAGYILTNQHVVGGADKIMVTVLGYEEPFEAELLGSSYDLDLAVLKINGDKDFPTLKLGDSDAIAVGEWVVAIGNPNGFDHTVTVGVLSAKERPITIQDPNGTRQYQHLLQTDASINPGNSGGPLLNLNGEVIGMNTAVSTTAQGIGFAIPTSTILEVLDVLKENKPVPQPFIGATLADVTETAARQLGLDDTKGSVVVNILYNSPAYKADLRQYDVIVGMDGKKYDTKEELIKAIQNKKVGDQAVLDVIRGGRQIQITVTIGDKNDYNVE
ncbi:trypsin-like peptidase domain-containing protein [Thermobacillus sp. ZCTH02-B1]|uniref:S1C family serine protease n=1 Tax=Thermobacillus sp. ZCTH02-B1 TaxID=1858795 RepID=UPI0025F69A3E|nr:trypsin-like peptidase domain-containing protein [Thermobacillus sp. ZCTH02-B1]